jgi:hypothetical protein
VYAPPHNHDDYRKIHVSGGGIFFSSPITISSATGYRGRLRSISEIRSLYCTLSGTQVFTREVIQDVSQQLRDLKGKGRTVFVKAFNGAIVKFAVKIAVYSLVSYVQNLSCTLRLCTLAPYIGITNKALMRLLSGTHIY